jgi:mono/diheme cytochrome c family protein
MKRSTLITALASLLAIVIVGAVVADRFGVTSSDFRLRPDDPTLLATGERIYATQCASCHGAQLEGQAEWRTRGADGLLPAPPHDASGHTWHHPDEMLFRITKYGVASLIGDPSYRTAMPVYEQVLSDEEIIAVLSWIKAQWPASVREKHDQMNAQAAKASRS